MIKKTVSCGATYIAASAGAVFAGTTIKHVSEFDSNNAGVKDYAGLELFEGIVLPHYTPKDLRRYIENSPELDKLMPIYSIHQDGVLKF